MRVYGLNSRRPTSPVAGEGERGRQVSSALPGSLARLTGPCAEGFQKTPQLQVVCRRDVGERRDGGRE